MRLLDLFCGAGGAAMGYHRAGFDIVGIDIEAQPRYPFEFVQADALEYLRHCDLSGFDLIHASPPCQVYSVTAALANEGHPDLLEPTRQALINTGLSYVIENVPGAPLRNPIMLCGTMFGLRVIRHRLFETLPPIYFAPATCRHWGKSTGSAAYYRQNGSRNGVTASLDEGFAFVTVCGNDYLADEGRRAMGIDWMVKSELSQAIPPAYTEWLGLKMLELIRRNEK